ncbi:PaaX family transcriptional regulator C-terminal domain-containing protein [Nocardia africana]|uniref:Phenylacetic acid-responsive transcriptional repressor n=1 Tax=Nocardia africana TaxID=134964 RepID=A0A378WXB7_9NOCA|nr:PaaX family transcriptional regulator C-terminal domain-containing protein [Nocardia africana]MCC3313570.1 PaaX domain-containing protein, C- domain protein [Nocardia africana]SUA45054.1 Phenylacetic acid-responsive transcriptional repressor [Nocardia africana]
MGSSAAGVRRLTARSAILSVLLGAHPGEAPVSWIVRVAAGLGLQESAVRAALTRMVAAGDLERVDATYRLSARLIDRQRRQDEAVASHRAAWDGQWRMALVTVGADDSSDRAALREALQHMKFGEIREGVWARPRNLHTVVPAAAERRLSFFTGVPDEPPAELAERLFRPRAWADTARRLLSAFDTADTIAARLEIAAATVRHILVDPLLPTELLPPRWPGEALRDVYAGFRTEFTAFAEELLGTSTAEVVSG